MGDLKELGKVLLQKVFETDIFLLLSTHYSPSHLNS